jgi:4-hydroxy-tetrahydrodipicolinate synthase
MYSGDDETACEFCLQGGVGVISVTANVAPALMHKMCKAAIAGDRQVAEQYDSSIAGLHKQLFVESNPIPAKWAVHEMGLIDCGIRLPLTWLQDDFRQLVRDAMDQAGI